MRRLKASNSNPTHSLPHVRDGVERMKTAKFNFTIFVQNVQQRVKCWDFFKRVNMKWQSGISVVSAQVGT